MEPMQQDFVRHENHDFSDPNILKQLPYRHRMSPVIVTLADPETTTVDIQKMIELGINAVRFKMSHSTKEEKIKLLSKVDKATEILCEKHGILDWPLTTCVDLKTSIVKTGLLEEEEESITIKEGSHVVLTCDFDEFDKCTASKIFVDNPYIAVDIKIGMKIALGKDEAELQCKKIIDDKSIKCLVTKTGQLMNMTLVFVKGAADRTRASLSKKDMKIVRFALEYQVDMIIVNYARESDTIKKIKQYIGKNRKRPIILAGVCTPKGLDNIDDIIQESDGIVFSREFLSYELDVAVRYRLVHIQKWAGAKCQEAGKPFYISGGVFQKALACGTFCDHETVDVTNALLDGATGFVLKECPDIEMVLQVLRTINELCCIVEPLTHTKRDFWRVLEGIPMPVNAAEACAVSCAAVAHQSKARVIVIPTVTGDTVNILLRLRTECIVITISTKTSTTRRLKLCRCVIPMLFKGGKFNNWYEAVEARIQFAVEHAVKVGWLKMGDNYVTLQRGTEKSAFCDMVRARNVTISKKAMVECPDDTEKSKRPISIPQVNSKHQRPTL